MKVFEGISSPWREVACGAGVRKGRGRELGRETAREGGGFLSFLPRAPKFLLRRPLLTPATKARRKGIRETQPVSRQIQD